MGKASKSKLEYLDTVEMTDLIQTLKDIAENKYYSMIRQKDKFRRFGETFLEFFRLVNLTNVEHPLLSNNNKTTGILTITAEGSFLADFNNKVIHRALNESEKHEDFKFLCIGKKGVDRLSEKNPDIKAWVDVESIGLYELAVEVKDYLIDEVLSGRLGRIVVAHAWSKSFELYVSRATKLLPCDALLSKQAKLVNIVEDVIEESNPVDIIASLCDLWVTTRLYEMLVNSVISSSSAQANFLDDSVENMKKERKKALIKFRKSKKSDIDKSLRETFSARMIQVKK